MPAPLTIYRASAGAGKTFRLVVEYIKLLMLRPDEYKHILAVTFTKKATQEMKIRILSQLYGLREGLSSSNGYMKCISEEMQLPEHEIRKNSGIALEMILNDYGHFRIETIDSFFQRVLRNMTRELDISSNMRVEINGEQVKNNAVDALIDSLEPKDHIFQRIVAFAEERMNDGKKWNVVDSLKTFGNSIFTNFYQSHSKQYNECAKDPNLFTNYRKYLNESIKSAEEEIADVAHKLRELIEAQGLDISIFKNNRNGFGKLYEYLDKDNFTTIPKLLIDYSEGDAETWLKKADLKKYDTSVITDILQPALIDYLKIHKRDACLILTCKEIRQNLHNIELLGAIEQAVDESNVKANRFLLSSTNQLLSEMIGESDSPFIFEKIGTQIKHLMIDEFQDTSTLQWANFKILMQECMSHYDYETARGTVGSMIVGDVKQSIYRWRDGDWQLLNNIKEEFDGEENTEIKNLDTNFRSEANIINFNNAFFLNIKDICNVEKAYDDVSQNVKPGRVPKGKIEFYMLSKSAYKTRHKMICDKVNSLIQSGVKPKNIAVLGRNGSILKELSKTFMDYYPEINVVSQESFVISTSMAVKTIVTALRLLLKPTDRILLATLSQYTGFTEETCQETLSGINTSIPLLDVVEEIYCKFNVGRLTDDSAFISAFFDQLSDFASKNTSTIRNFLKNWDETINQKTIETEATNGVQMMTIHKSKGLEFDNVIIADGNWPTSVSKNEIWIELSEEPLSAVPFTVIKAKNALENTIFKDDFLNECKQFEVDNLNLLYVAFTRAGKNLYFYGETGQKKYEDIIGKTKLEKYTEQNMCGKVEQCLDTLSIDMATSFDCYQDEEDESKYYYVKHFGEFAGEEEHDKEESGNVFDMEIHQQSIKLHQNKPEVTFLQSNRSKDFVAGISETPETPETLETPETPETSETPKSISYVSTGLLLHNVLSQIESIDHVDTVLERLEMEGVISDKKHSSLIKKRITDNEYARTWFAPGWTVYNECSILTTEGIRRPDRVITNGTETIVIDFKFGKPKSEHKEQVTEYAKLLTAIGLPNVKGYLWYVYDNKVEELCF